MAHHYEEDSPVAPLGAEEDLPLATPKSLRAALKRIEELEAQYASVLSDFAIAKQQERIIRLAERERCLKILDEENELNGPMPEVMWKNICADRELAENVFRNCVIVTKQNLAERMKFDEVEDQAGKWRLEYKVHPNSMIHWHIFPNTTATAIRELVEKDHPMWTILRLTYEGNTESLTTSGRLRDEPANGFL